MASGIADIPLAFIDPGSAWATAGTLLLAGALSGRGTLSAGTGALADITGGGCFGGAFTGAGTLAIASDKEVVPGCRYPLQRANQARSDFRAGRFELKP